MATTLRQRKLDGAGASDAAEADPSGKLRRAGSPDAAGRRGGIGVLGLVAMLVLAFAVNFFQTQKLPKPLSVEEAGKLGFSEERALAHLTILSSFGLRPVGSEALEHSLDYVLQALEKIKSGASPNVYMEIDNFHSRRGMNRLQGGLFKGKTLAYAELRHLVVRLSSKLSPDGEDNAVLVSSHLDTVYTSPGGGDCGSCVSVMLELVRALSHSVHIVKHSVMFLFNTGEEEGLDGAHSFITQHPWRSSVRTFVDLEAMGAGGKAYLFQAGPDKFLIDVFAKVVRHPAANIIAQDVFQAGLFKSATDFQVYREVAGLSGLDFAYTENGAVYHTRNDALKLVRAGSLQQLGDNMLPLLIEAAASPELAELKPSKRDSKMETVYFDILGTYMVTFTRDFARTLYSSILVQSLLLFAGSLVRAESFSVTALTLAAFAVLLSWVCALSFGVGAAALVSVVSTHPIPYIAHPVLVLGLFGSSAVFGGVLGHSAGQRLLSRHLTRFLSRASAAADAEKFMFKAAFLQWLSLLALGVWSGAGSSYIPAAWLAIPALAYGLNDASLSKTRQARGLSLRTLLFGLPLPVILSADIFLNLPKSLIGNLVRIERHPGALSPFHANGVIALVTAAITCLALSYLLPYIHRKGDKVWILLSSVLIFALSLTVVVYEFLPAFTKDVGKGTYVVHVIEASNANEPQSYVSVSFTTPGSLENEARLFTENGFSCGTTNKPDFVTFKVVKGCSRAVQPDNRLWETQPTLTILSDETVDDQRTLSVVFDAKRAQRWVMAIDTNKIEQLQVETITDQNVTETLIPLDKILGAEDGWHTVQFASGRNGPRKFRLKLVWQRGSLNTPGDLVFKLRTDLNILTREAAATLQLLPATSVLFGKSTSPYTLAYLLNLVTP